MRNEGIVRLNEPIVALREILREFLVILAIAGIAGGVAVESPGPTSIGIAVVAGAAFLIVLVAILPFSVRLRVDDEGLRVVAFLVFARSIPWSAIGTIEVAEGWSGETVAIDVHGPAGEGVVLGLPVDPTLGRRAFVTTFGLGAERFAELLRTRRDAVHATK